MYKRLPIVLLIILCSACTKTRQTACGTQTCTDLYAYIGVMFKDKNNNAVSVANFTVTDLRTNMVLTNNISASADFVPGFRVIVDDSDLKDLTTDGDNVRVTASNPATSQTINTLFKISGGCNCHVAKLSVPDTIKFN
jgi:hypothetical protein